MIPHILLILVFTFLGCIHFYWAFGGKWGVNSTFPVLDNSPKDFKPPLIATIIVGLGLLIMGLFYLLILLSFQNDLFISVTKYVQWIIPCIFVLRAIGDFKFVGLFKSKKDSIFAALDTKLFTPLCLLIALLGFLSINNVAS